MDWVEDLEKDEGQSCRKNDPTHGIIGQFGLFNSLSEDTDPEFATVEVDAHGNEDPLVKVDEVRDAKEQTTCIVK